LAERRERPESVYNQRHFAFTEGDFCSSAAEADMNLIHWLQSHSLQLIGPIIGLLGLCFAFIRDRKARNASKKLHDTIQNQHTEIQRLHEKIQKQHEENQKLVNEVLLSLSTRYTKARFPDYLGEVAALVSRSKREDELLIIVDYVGTGHYSSPEGFRAYFEAIMSAPAAKIRMLVYGEEAAKEVFQRQFKKKLDGTVEQDEHFSKYFGFYGIPLQTGYENFLNTLARKHGDFCEAFASVRPKIEIRVLSPPSMREGFWFWMIRDKQMIFASPSFAEVTNKGLAFFTSDNTLMQVFLDRFENKWRQGIELDIDAKTSGWPRRVEKLFPTGLATGQSATQ
jgi:hypothetical protein